jgi:hypothetical protein
VWGALPNAHPVCFEQRGDAVVDAACPDPFGFFPGVVDATVELDPDGDGHFELQLSHLPSAAALVGTDVSHVAYGSLIVVADTDENGRISLRPEPRPIDPMNGPPDGGKPGDAFPELEAADTPLAASFVTLKADQERVVFREGDFTGLNLYYPAPACDTPPTGFSVIQTGAYTDSSAACGTFGLDHAVELAPLSDSDANALSCRALQRFAHTQQPDSEEPPKRLTQHCIGKDLLIAVSDGTCPGMLVMALSGCEDDPKCEKPEWDERANPPEWWPCED